MIFQKILAPTDLSEPSFRAIRKAMSLAQESGAELTLLRVLLEADIASGETDVETERRHLEDVVRDYAPSGLVVETRVIEGNDVTKAILSAAREEHSDLIVMATHGTSGWREFVLGSITGEVVRTASCPVLTISNASMDNGTMTQPQQLREDSGNPQIKNRQQESNERKKIVCPLDFSPTSYNALENAEQLARHLQAELLLVHVIPYPAPNDQGFKTEEEAYNFASKNAENQLRLIIDTHLGNLKDVRFEILSGSPAGQLVADVARNEGADLVVLGTHGWAGWRRLVLGSVTEDVMHLADCPVLTVHSSTVDFDAEDSSLQILCPIDFSEPSSQALKAAGEMALTLNAELRVMHVMKSPQSEPDEGLTQELVTLIEECLPDQVHHSVQSNHLFRSGNPAAEIVRVAEDEGYDMIVMATQGGAGWRRHFVGSTTSEVVRTATCPVLTIGQGNRANTNNAVVANA